MTGKNTVGDFLKPDWKRVSACLLLGFLIFFLIYNIVYYSIYYDEHELYPESLTGFVPFMIIIFIFAVLASYPVACLLARNSEKLRFLEPDMFKIKIFIILIAYAFLASYLGVQPLHIPSGFEVGGGIMTLMIELLFIILPLALYAAVSYLQRFEIFRKFFVKILIIAPLVVIGGMLLMPIDEKSCSKDDDCLLVSRGCCDFYGPGDAVNNFAAVKINLAKRFGCGNANCPLENRIAVPGPSVHGAACKQSQCVAEEYAKCSGICSGTDVKYYSSRLNKTEGSLFQKCSCDEISLIVEGCDMNNPAVNCFSGRTIVVGTVKQDKIIGYSTEEVTISVDKSFSGKLENAVTFRTGRWMLKEGDKIKAFVGELNYAGILEILNETEYQKLIGLNYIEYLPLSMLNG
jgi:hypothetical protein